MYETKKHIVLHKRGKLWVAITIAVTMSAFGVVSTSTSAHAATSETETATAATNTTGESTVPIGNSETSSTEAGESSATETTDASPVTENSNAGQPTTEDNTQSEPTSSDSTVPTQENEPAVSTTTEAATPRAFAAQAAQVNVPQGLTLKVLKHDDGTEYKAWVYPDGQTVETGWTSTEPIFPGYATSDPNFAKDLISHLHDGVYGFAYDPSTGEWTFNNYTAFRGEQTGTAQYVTQKVLDENGNIAYPLYMLKSYLTDDDIQSYTSVTGGNYDYTVTGNLLSRYQFSLLPLIAYLNENSQSIEHTTTASSSLPQAVQDQLENILRLGYTEMNTATYPFLANQGIEHAGTATSPVSTIDSWLATQIALNLVYNPDAQAKLKMLEVRGDSASNFADSTNFEATMRNIENYTKIDPSLLDSQLIVQSPDTTETINGITYVVKHLKFSIPDNVGRELWPNASGEQTLFAIGDIGLNEAIPGSQVSISPSQYVTVDDWRNDAGFGGLIAADSKTSVKQGDLINWYIPADTQLNKEVRLDLNAGTARYPYQIDSYRYADLSDVINGMSIDTLEQLLYPRFGTNVASWNSGTLEDNTILKNQTYDENGNPEFGTIDYEYNPETYGYDRLVVTFNSDDSQEAYRQKLIATLEAMPEFTQFQEINDTTGFEYLTLTDRVQSQETDYAAINGYNVIRQTIDGTIIDQTYHLGNTGDVVTAHADPIDGLTLIGDSTQQAILGTSDNTIIFTYGQTDAQLTFKFVDEAGQSLAPDKSLTAQIGNSFDFTAPQIDDYTFVSADQELFGTITGNNTITLTYRKNGTESELPSETAATLVFKFVDKDGNTLAPDQSLDAYLGSGYDLTAPQIPDYTFVSADHALSGTITGDSVITLTYEKTGANAVIPTETSAKLVFKFIDENGNTLAPDQTLAGYVGNAYNLNAPQIADYTFVSADHELVGTITGDNTITLTYRKNGTESEMPTPTTAALLFKFVDENGKTILPDLPLAGYVGNGYSLTPPEIDGYTFVSADKPLTGIITEDGVITLTYHKVELNPGNPTEPVNPAEPENPTGPTTPVEPVNPGQPTEPGSTPSDSDESTAPADPVDTIVKPTTTESVKNHQVVEASMLPRTDEFDGQSGWLASIGLLMLTFLTSFSSVFKRKEH